MHRARAADVASVLRFLMLSSAVSATDAVPGGCDQLVLLTRSWVSPSTVTTTKEFKLLATTLPDAPFTTGGIIWKHDNWLTAACFKDIWVELLPGLQDFSRVSSGRAERQEEGCDSACSLKHCYSVAERRVLSISWLLHVMRRYLQLHYILCKVLLERNLPITYCSIGVVVVGDATMFISSSESWLSEFHKYSF